MQIAPNLHEIKKNISSLSSAELAQRVVKVKFSKLLVNLYFSRGKFGRQQIDDIFLFPGNRIWHFMQIVSSGVILHGMSNPVSVKIKKKVSVCRPLKFLSSMQSVNIAQILYLNRIDCRINLFSNLIN